jgi:predicted aspartyl protease
MDIMKYDVLIEKRRIIVRPQIKVNDEDRNFKFILDTGVSISVIDDSLVSRLGFDLQKLKAGDRLTTVGGGVKSKILELPKFSLFGKEIVNFEVNVMKLPTQILYFAYGLIGMDFLLKFDNLKFDFVNKLIET